MKQENNERLITEYDRLIEGLKKIEEERASDQILASPGYSNIN